MMLPSIIPLVLIIIFLNTITSSSSSELEIITNLPGQPIVSFKQYGGYVTVDARQHRHLFYYFVEAQVDPTSRPLLLWLNGGPGCSSVGVGAFSGNGPFRPNGDVLEKNGHSWNKEANVLYLESPAGVGFSYSTNKSFYNSLDDDNTARDNLMFLQNWLKKFPEYKKRDLFIAGESYAGHYIPQLANLILTSKLKSNLKGVAIGNPLLDYNTDLNSRGEYLWSHGLISDSTYELLQTVCNYSQIERQRALQDFLSPPCDLVGSQMESEIGIKIDQYGVTSDVCLRSVHQQAHLKWSMKLDEVKLNACQHEETIKYLNRKDVQNSIHAELVGFPAWGLCNSGLNYRLEDREVPTLPLLGTLTKAGIRVLIYSGDQDSMIPLLGTRKLLKSLAKELRLNTTVPYRFWLQNKQVAGWTEAYGDILAFATVRGAAHEGPLSQPARSLELFRSFIRGKPLPGLSTITR